METRTTGTGEVHTHLSNQPDKGVENSGKYDLNDAMQEASDRMDGMAGQAQQRAGEMMDQARGKMDEMRGRAQEMASQAKSRASEMLGRAESTLEQKTGALSTARDYPLAALGAAFAVGFLLAGSGDEKKRSRGGGGGGGALGTLKHQITGAIMGGVTAAITQELKSFVEQQGGVGNLMSQFTGQGSSQQSAGSGTGGHAPA